MQWKPPYKSQTSSESGLFIFCMQGVDEKNGVSKTFIAKKGNTGSKKQDDIAQ